MQYLQGIIGMVIGLLILIYRPKIKDFTGDIGFAEKWLGSGGTWTFFIILGVGIFVLGLMWATGSLQSFMVSKFSQFI